MQFVYFLLFFTTLLTYGLFLSTRDQTQTERSFIFNEEDNFIKNGHPYRYVSGSFHYFRTPQVYWNDRLTKMRAAGLNALQTYIEWSSHEPEPNEFRFSGDLNITLFLQLAQKHELDVILRIGPYIDAERDMGGLPYWLLRENPSMGLRKNDPTFLTYVNRWFSKLLPMMVPLLYRNGGPIIMIQVENEYGSTNYCDEDYKNIIRDMIKEHVHDNVVLFTVDGDSDSFIKCGRINDPKVLTTIDFGTSRDPLKSFRNLRKYQKTGPLVNSEFYTGWLDHWAHPHQNVSADIFAYSLEYLLKLNASVNMYMFYGGTSFGFKAGSNLLNNFVPVPTSYDYDAPLSEAGDPTPKYFLIRNVVSKFLPLPDIPIPKPAPKFEFGPINVEMILSFSQIADKFLDQKVFNLSPLTFEQLSVQNGFILYSTKINFIPTDPDLLTIKGLNDRATIVVDRKYQGTLSRSENINSLPIVAQNGSLLEILVENQGRICYGDMIKEPKGITGQVSLGTTVLTNWQHSFMKDWERLPHMLSNLSYSLNQTCNGRYNLPAIYRGSFNGNPASLDSFLNLNMFKKGVAYLNGHCLGRYWPKIGPQVNLYSPGSWFNRASKNEIILFELNGTSDQCLINFLKKPYIDSPTPYASER